MEGGGLEGRWRGEGKRGDRYGKLGGREGEGGSGREGKGNGMEGGRKVGNDVDINVLQSVNISTAAASLFLFHTS